MKQLPRLDISRKETEVEYWLQGMNTAWSPKLWIIRLRKLYFQMGFFFSPQTFAISTSSKMLIWSKYSRSSLYHFKVQLSWLYFYKLNPLLFCSVTAKQGASVTLPCIIHSYDKIAGYRIEWTKVNDKGTWTDVLLSISSHKKANGNFNNRVFLGGSKDEDGSLVIKNVSMGDIGRYRCEIENGEEDVMHDIILEVESGLSKGKFLFFVLFYFDTFSLMF